MSVTWNGAAPERVRAPCVTERLRMVLRALALVLVTYLGIPFVVLFNLVERAAPLGVAHRIACLWGRICLWLCGVRVLARGTPMRGGGAVVANHAGWIDIFTLLTADRVYFVSKAEVAGWPLVGWLSRQIGTVYIDRRRTSSKAQAAMLHDRLARGDRLCFFPEGTSTDGRRVLPFKSTLFAPFTAEGLRDELWVQPVSIVYHPAPDLPRSFYGWWGEMPLGPHLKAVFALSRGGVAEVIHHPPLRAADFADRKALAAACEEAVRAGVTAALEAALETGRDPA
ncbi:1-acyl-sn-glycerol-3-phosphate acyltransferase [Halovulum dunhuangense]|uniref:1-acyl-sn-glycerol-3-phosphate acyltransferase n=1 Tax=Halovulum dunhuangense TaxID=1505036 RepID=A0A849L2D0_9RHOB|nr:lysophospholipid acyltransferase family protein [Halovulum dunhuangense]NNU80476.1 1-acyl-sn-glycerol-3-phosphate acyltransferase [Halovulum dunhuangense]